MEALVFEKRVWGERSKAGNRNCLGQNKRLTTTHLRFLSLIYEVLFPTVRAVPKEEQHSVDLVEKNYVYGDIKHEGKLVFIYYMYIFRSH